MNATKLRLSEDELRLAKNADWLLTKNNIIRKVYLLFGELAGDMVDSIKKSPVKFSSEILNHNAKISKGENYGGLPFVMLDYPRFFDKENIFAIRSMFWWGNFFSMTLHLKGKYKEKFAGSLSKNFQFMKNENFFVCTSDDEWHHHFDSSNYTPLNTLDERKFQKIVLENPFCKLSVRIDLEHWNDSKELLDHSFAIIVQALQ